MKTFNPQDYGPRIAPLIDTDRCRPLDGGSGAAAGPSLGLDDLFDPAEIIDRQGAKCCVAAVLLLSDALDASHNWSQQVETPEGSFWHAIMHRRERDFSNAKYWFRRVGPHPIDGPLGEAAKQVAAQMGRETPLAQGPWDAMAMVDACQRASSGQAETDLLQALQQREWELLFDYCYRLAVGR